MCDWENLAVDGAEMRGVLARQEGYRLSPFHMLSTPGMSAREQRACSELWTRERRTQAAGDVERRAFTFAGAPGAKLRLGYLSNDFHDHATARLLVETLEAHDRKRFALNAYSFGPDDGSLLRGRVRDAFDRFVEIGDLSDAEAAERINEDGVDILIDLKGFTARARTGIVLLRPAPVLVNYLGYPGTLGEGVCDYIITDRFITPAASAGDYAESFAYMPYSYQPHGRRSPIGTPPAREAAGLPDGGFVFCCLNQSYKITPEIFDIWCRLLQAVPGSVLWLLHDEKSVGNLRSEAVRRGVDARRLVFAAHMSQQGHLERLQLADLMLDTIPFNAHTTASDALWAGVPLITCPGETFASRVAGSLLRAIGLDELVVDDVDDYFSLAYALATEEGRLQELRERLSRNRLTTPLFDVDAYTLDLEKLFEGMMLQHRSGLPPQCIDPSSAGT